MPLRLYGGATPMVYTWLTRRLISLLPQARGCYGSPRFSAYKPHPQCGQVGGKALSTHLAPKIPQIVGPHQGAFIKGRCLHDNFQLVQCITRWLHALKSSVVMFKLDFTNTFDTAGPSCWRSWPSLTLGLNGLPWFAAFSAHRLRVWWLMALPVA
jgi:hypothetical protein